MAWSILQLTKAWKFSSFAAIWFDQTGAHYSRVGRISVLYKVVSVFRDRPHLLDQGIRSSLYLFLQQATTKSVWSLKIQVLSTIKPGILALLSTLHVSFPSVKSEFASPSEFKCFTSVLNPFIWILHVLHHFPTILIFLCRILGRVLSTGAHTSFCESSAYLNLIPVAFVYFYAK